MKQGIRPELKPCPFCGNNDLFLGIYSGADTVACKCGASIGGEESFLSKDEVITRWNTRHCETCNELAQDILAAGGVQHSGLCSPEYFARENALQEKVDNMQEPGLCDDVF